MLNSSQDQEDKGVSLQQQHIIVSIRIRPLSSKETDAKELLPWLYDESSIYLLEDSSVIFDSTTMNCNHNTSSIKQSFKFDHIFHPIHTNEYIYSSMVQKIVHSSMNGYHGTILTYGQTSSGKTFTMNGDSTQIGIMFQAINDCFNLIHSYRNREFLLRMSYLEVYNEQIKDLLNTEPTLIKLQYDSKLQYTVLSGVKEHVILNPQQAMSLITAGEAHRHVGSTDMNEKSSRAHTLLKIIIESKESIPCIDICLYSSNNDISQNNNNISGAIRTSTLYLVDLAGSESAKMTNSKGQRAKEAKHINQSLLTLSSIIQRLSEEKSNNIINECNNTNSMKRSQHLPYRDSKLTRILENALDGNAHIGMICTISPTVICIDESLNTLKFASRAKLIKIGAKINETVDDKTLLRAYRDEIEHLRDRLKQLESSSNPIQQSLNYTSSSNLDDDIIESCISNIGTDDEDGEAIMLQMISEIERLIIKADISRSPLKSSTTAALNANIPPQNSDITLASSSTSIATSSSSKSISTVINNNSMISLPSFQRDDSIKNPRVSAIPIRNDYNEILASQQQSYELSSNDDTMNTSSSNANLTRRISRLIPKGTFRVRSIANTSIKEPSSKLDNTDSNKLVVGPGISQNEIEPQQSQQVELIPVFTLSKQQIAVPEQQLFKANAITATAAIKSEEVLVDVVSKMLSLLKGHLAKSYHNRNNTTSSSSSSSKSTPLPSEGTNMLDIMNINSNTKNRIELLPMVDADESLQASQSHTSSIIPIQYQQLLLDLKLKDADNRFLQEELDNKDQMLQMLTDGLKEIEQSQNLWLNRNQELSYELQRAISHNKILENEIDELKKQLKKN